MSTIVSENAKAGLLAHYAAREPYLFHQYDVFLNAGSDDLAQADTDGDQMFRTASWELKSGVPVRIHVLDGTPKAEAIRAVAKVLTWLVKDYPEDGAVPEGYGGDPAFYDGAHGAEGKTENPF